MTEDEAYQLMHQRLGTAAHGGSSHMRLLGFDAGWIIVRDAEEGLLGGNTLVIDANSRQLLSFPSSVPPERIRTQWERVRSRARVVEGHAR